MEKGFTLIELIVVIGIICILSGIILFSVTQYINKGKDSNIYGNLAVLVPAGEVYYNANSYSYSGFCDPSQNSVIKNSYSQMPQNPAGYCLNSLTPGVCCYVNSDGSAWVACAKEFTAPRDVFCVDSRGMREEITNGNCTDLANTYKCP